MLRFFVFCLCLAASGAHSHASQQASIPVDGATVSAVPVVELTFASPVRITTLTVIGPDGPVAVTAETGAAPASIYRAVPDAPLTPAAYAVEWRGLAEDGHVMQGSFTFTVSAD